MKYSFNSKIYDLSYLVPEFKYVSEPCKNLISDLLTVSSKRLTANEVLSKKWIMDDKNNSSKKKLFLNSLRFDTQL